MAAKLHVHNRLFTPTIDTAVDAIQKDLDQDLSRQLHPEKGCDVNDILARMRLASRVAYGEYASSLVRHGCHSDRRLIVSKILSLLCRLLFGRIGWRPFTTPDQSALPQFLCKFHHLSKRVSPTVKPARQRNNGIYWFVG